jgi:hypothetical protein
MFAMKDDEMFALAGVWRHWYNARYLEGKRISGNGDVFVSGMNEVLESDSVDSACSGLCHALYGVGAAAGRWRVEGLTNSKTNGILRGTVISSSRQSRDMVFAKHRRPRSDKLVSMADVSPNHRILWFETGLFAVLSILSCFFIVRTLRWPLVGDASLIHYVVFLIQTGHAPYRDIVDINMPGMYLVDWAVIKYFGGGSLAWRFFDFFLVGIAALSMLAIAWPYNRLAGVFAAALFLLVHGRDGVAQTGQRDLIIAVLLLASVAFLFLAVRSKTLWLTTFTGLFAGLAATIKPTAALFALGFLISALMVTRKSNLPLWRIIIFSITGFIVPIVIVAIFLYREHALMAFWNILHGLVPYHASLDHRHQSFLILHSISPLLPLVFPWLYFVVKTRCWRNWEHATLLIAIACGLLSYSIQRKGYPYHRYPLLAFLLLSMGIIFTLSCRRKGLDRFLGGSALLVGVLVIAPVSAVMATRYDWHNQEFITMLQSDLNQLGGATLSNHVQCMDTTAGCINTLYRMNLVQSTGSLYDCYFFAPRQTDVTAEIRTRFWNELQINPPHVFVVSDQFCLGGSKSYNKLGNWPQFSQYLEDNYILLEERTPLSPVRWWSVTQAPMGYRVYIRKTPDSASSQ